MLNYIWLGLIIVGILVAAGLDVTDLSSNKYHNDEEFPVFIQLSAGQSSQLAAGQKYTAVLELHPPENGAADVASTAKHTVELVPASDSSGIVNITLDEKSPSLWSEIARGQKKEILTGYIRWEGSDADRLRGVVRFDPVRFTRLNAVTNDGIIKYAKTAVELAIGLIGIMALWLGLMKIADQSGLVAKVAAVMKPFTTRLFPDVPPDHPAMGAMIMNISANMLGLANAATPLGLKAMEELNRLNNKVGTATDAMCTFLVINTSNVQLIPATVIAIRATSGSSNPTDIIGPVLVASALTMIIAIIVVKVLAKLPMYRRELSEGATP